MNDDASYQKAQKKVQELKGFYSHLGSFIGVNILLLVINLITSPDSLWFYYITIIWGIFLIWHAVRTFGNVKFFGDEWEEEKIKKIMDQEKK